MVRLSVWMIPLGAILACTKAHAQDAERSATPSLPSSHLSIQAPEPSVELRIVAAGESSPIAECSQYCDFWALPGRYTLYTRDLRTGAQHQLSLRIKGSTRYELQEGDDSARSVGLGLGISGSAAIVVGLVLALPLVMSAMCEDSNCTTPGERLAGQIGLGSLLAGAITTPIGWSMFAHNRTRLRQLDDSPYSANDGAVRVGVVGLGRGALGLGGVAVF